MVLGWLDRAGSNVTAWLSLTAANLLRLSLSLSRRALPLSLSLSLLSLLHFRLVSLPCFLSCLRQGIFVMYVTFLLKSSVIIGLVVS